MDAAFVFYHSFSLGNLPAKQIIKNIQPVKNTLRVQRAIKNITQAELAEKIGVSRQTINTIESNKYVPSTMLALKMAKLFGKPVEEIFMLEKSD